MDNVPEELERSARKVRALLYENERLKKKLAQLQGASGDVAEPSPTSYVTPSGDVRLPHFVIEHLHLSRGGGVVFHKNGQYIRMMTNDQASRALGWSKAPAAEPKCTCIEDANAKLEKDNTRLVLEDGSPIVATERIRNLRDGKKPIVVFPKFCPFCGEGT